MTTSEVAPPTEKVPVPATSAPHQLKSLHHIAMTVPDLVEAERWYIDVLGAKSIERHAWGGDTKPTRPHVDLQVADDVFSFFLGDAAPSPSRLMHYAFDGGNLDQLDDWRAHLDAKGIEMSPPVFHPGYPAISVYFRDPWGHRLEIFTEVDTEEEALAEAEKRGGGKFEPPRGPRPTT